MSYSATKVNNTAPVGGDISVTFASVVGTPADGDTLVYSSVNDWRAGVSSASESYDFNVVKGDVNFTSTAYSYTTSKWAFSWRDAGSFSGGSSTYPLVNPGAVSPTSSNTNWAMAARVDAGTYLACVILTNRQGRGDAVFRPSLATSAAGANNTPFGPSITISGSNTYSGMAVFRFTAPDTRYLFFQFLSGDAQLHSPPEAGAFSLWINKEY